jgi:hypothetical protein
MLPSSAGDHPEAYVPADAVREPSPVREPSTRAEVVAAAREQRLDEGLAVDEATLEQVVDAVLAPDYPAPGLYFTLEELRDRVPEATRDRVHTYLDEHPDVDGGIRSGWRDGRRVLVVGIAGSPDDVERAAAALADDRVVVERRGRSVLELEALSERLDEDRDELGRLGLRPVVWGPVPEAGVVEAEVIGGPDPATVQRRFAERYGSDVRVVWLGPSRHREVACSFGSYAAEGTSLRVFLGIDLNGEEPGPARVVRQDEHEVVVAASRLVPIGPATLLGGWQGVHADVALDRPLGDRAVVDHTTGARRPSVHEPAG